MALLFASACGASKAPVVVRMATDGEVFPEPPLPQPPPGRRIKRTGCALSGAPVKDLYEPVAAFAKSHLIRHDADFVVQDDAVRTYVVMPGLPEPPKRNGLDIIVDPRAIRGQLLTRIRLGSWFAGTGYCLHVQRDPDVTTVIVQKRWTWIK